MKSNSRKRRKVDPKTLKKASRTRRQYAEAPSVAGNKKRTRTGYIIPGTKCADYETYFEFLGPAQSSHVFVHPKKTRTIRVLDGRGFAMLRKDEESKSLVLAPGMELTIPAGIAFSVATTSSNSLSLFITQSAKYESSIQVVKTSDTELDKDKVDLESHTNTELVRKTQPRRRRRGQSKAAEQQMKLRAERGQLPPAPTLEVADVVQDKTLSPNVRPSYGRDMRGEPG